jgi:hypothetical protein
MSLIPSRAAVAADARNRAWRTLVQGLALDVGAAVVGVLVAEVADVRWTRAYWALVGGLVAKSALQAAVAFAARRLVPPKA